MKKPNVCDCHIIELSDFEISDTGVISIRENSDIPFEIKRVFYSYNIPDRKTRGAHAHKACHQLLIAASGNYEIVLDDGKAKRTVLLKDLSCGLHIPPGIWASEQEFSHDAICLVFASHAYDESDYIRNYEEFLEYTNRHKI